MAFSQTGTPVSDTNNTAIPVTGSYTVPADATIVWLAVNLENANETSTFTITLGGNAATGIIEAQQGTGFLNNAVVAYWIDTDIPASGSQTYSATFSGTAGTLEISVFIDSFTTTGAVTLRDSDTANQTTGTTITNTFDGSGAGSGSGGVSGNLCLAAASLGNTGTFTWSDSQVETMDFTDGSSQAGAAYLIATGTITTLTTTTAGSVNRFARAGAIFEEATEGITDVDSDYGDASDEFDLDEDSLDINGTNFEASQGTGTVYIADETTLAASNAEVEIDNAIQTWSDTVVNLDLTALTTEHASIETLMASDGPGLFVILVNDSSDEYSLAVTAHRAKAFNLSASANITASGENTTAQLTAPSGKTTGDFGGGRIQDDENPGDAVDLAADEYREDEWSIEAVAPSDGTYLGAQVTETYQFRLLIDGEEIDTYTVTPEWTISSGGTPGTANPDTIGLAVTVNTPTPAGQADTSPDTTALAVVVNNPDTSGQAQSDPDTTALAAVFNAATGTGQAETSPDTTALAATFNTPTPQSPDTAEPDTTALSVAFNNPDASGQAATTPDTTALAALFNTPDPTGQAQAAPAQFDLVVTFNTPSVGTPGTAEPDTTAITVTFNTPVSSGQAQTDPDTTGLIVTFNPPTLVGQAQADPAGFSPVLTFYTPTASSEVTATPDTINLAAVLNAPTPQSPGDTAPGAIDLATLFNTPSVSSPGDATPDATPLAVVINTPDASGQAQADPDTTTITVVFNTPAASGGGSGTATPDPIDLSAVFNTPTLIVPATASPDVFALSATLNTPTVGGGGGAAPSSIDLAAAFLAATVSGQAQADAGPIVLAVTLHTPTAIPGAGVSGTATPDPIELVVFIHPPTVTGDDEPSISYRAFPVQGGRRIGPESSGSVRTIPASQGSTQPR